MSIKQPTAKQKRYAHNIMNTDNTRRESARQAGYGEVIASHPARIEESRGFNLAMASIANQAGNLASEVMYTLKARDLEKEDTKTLIYSLDIISKAFERFQPKEKGLVVPTQDGMDAIFTRIIPVQQAEVVQDTVDSKDDTLHVV